MWRVSLTHDAVLHSFSIGLSVNGQMVVRPEANEAHTSGGFDMEIRREGMRKIFRESATS